MSPPETAVPVSDITRISHRFAVKWSIPIVKLRYEPPSSKNNSRIIKSNIYRFKDIKNLEFSFQLTCNDNDYKMEVNRRFDRPIFQDDALILIKDAIYRVECNKYNIYRGKILKPLTLAQNLFPDDKMTIHCIMSIPAEIKAVISNPEENREVSVIDCESILADPGVHPHGYDDVSEFLFSSRIPDFNVDMAIRMTREAHRRENPILKTLCVEYLTESLSTENVLQILKLSIDYESKNLALRCVEFISEHFQIVPLSQIGSPSKSHD